MIPVKRRNRIFTVIIVLAATIALISSIINPFFLLMVISYAYFAYKYWGEIKQPLPFVSFIFVVNCLMVWALPTNYFEDTTHDFYTSLTNFLLNYLISLIILLFPFYLFYKLYIKTPWMVGDIEKEHALLICNKHFTRTEAVFLYDEVIKIKCRKGDNCGKERNLIYAKHIVGLIGRNVNRRKFKGDYYIKMWDHKNQKVIDGDYDVIEIHEYNGIKSYDSVVNKIIDYFYNELNRYKSINQISVRVIGSPAMTDNTIRLLEKHFLSVEYLTSQQSKKSV